MGRGEGRERLANRRSCIVKGREANIKESIGLRNMEGVNRLPFKGNVTPLSMHQLVD